VTDIPSWLISSASAAPIPPLAPVMTTIVSDMNSAYRWMTDPVDHNDRDVVCKVGAGPTACAVD